MDSYRGNFGGTNDGDDFPASDYAEDETGIDTPPAVIGQDERRMQVRAYNHWASLLGDRHFPSIEDLEPTALPDFGPYSVLLDFTAGIDNPSIQFLGDALAEECGTDNAIRQLADVPSRSLLSRITDHYMQILANQAPIGFEAEFVNQRESTILYRGILLPFSSDDDTIDFIYGVINWKELADQNTTDELLLEIDQALGANPSALRREALETGPLTEWADGPADINGGNVLDLATPLEGSDGAEALPGPAFGRVPEETMALADWLASARELAEAARGSEDRTRQALYAAIGRAYDFSLAAAEAPEDFAELVTDAGLTVQERAPMTPVVKLVFGADYDKTRLTEYASALCHAQRIGLKRGELAGFLSAAPGGLKGVVGEERRLKRAEHGKPAAANDRGTALTQRLRKLDHRPLADVAREGSEFAVLVVRRLESGEVVMLGEVSDDPALLDRAARHLTD